MNGTLNKVILIGNLGDDVKIHEFDDQNKIGRFPLATSEVYTSRENGERITQTEWHNIVARNKVAEILEKYAKKGDKIYIEGKLKTRKWQDQNGQDKYMTEIIVNDFTFLSPKGSEPQSSAGSHQGAPDTSSNPAPPKAETETSEAPDDLPF